MIVIILTIVCLVLACDGLTTDDIWINELQYENPSGPGFVEIFYKSTITDPIVNDLRIAYMLRDSNTDEFVNVATFSSNDRRQTPDRNFNIITYPGSVPALKYIAIVPSGTPIVPIHFISFDGPRDFGGVQATLLLQPLPGSASTASSQSLRATGEGCKLSDFTLSWIHNSVPTPKMLNNDQLISCTGIGGGDPHFRTFDGTKYSFHGQCDLVMARTESMGSLGLPLAIHARTTIQSWYSYISQLALQIGSDTFEIAANGQHYLNGLMDAELPQLMVGKYEITKKEKTTVKAKSRTNVSSGNLTRTIYKIHLDGRDHIEISRFKGMLSVKVNVVLPNSEGMLGKQGTVGLIGRDGVTIMKDADAMGMEWQVRDDEPQLFVHDMNRAPQYPEQCTLPSVTGRRRMLRSNEDYERAKIACNDIKDRELQEFCIEDILITGDFDLVNAYSY